ncbi:MAG TPA: hypothetical protein ENN76_01360, partial [Euryarchaeota archaeon]|nr:hypothetical protein [Euryarchaeota archaeon]
MHRCKCSLMIRAATLGTVILLVSGLFVGIAYMDAVFDRPVLNFEGVGSFSVPNTFVKNIGQLENPHIAYYLNTPSWAVGFYQGGMMFSVPSSETVTLTFFNSSDVAPVGLDAVSWTSNFFYGNDPSRWHSDVPEYTKILYQDLWSGIDLVYYLDERGLKYDFVVHPGAHAENIRVQVDGHYGMEIGYEGELRIVASGGDIVDSGLYVFYEDNGEQLDACFTLDGDAYSFIIEGRDFDRTVVIDPLVYSSFLGGSSEEVSRGVAVDPDGFAYITGYTYSANFPVTTEGFQNSHLGGAEAFVAKLSKDGKRLIYSTFIGGDGTSVGNAIAVDEFGHAYIVGNTNSADFPTTQGSFSPDHNGLLDAFVLKLSPDGAFLIYSTFIGGSNMDLGHGIAIDGQGRAHV